MYKLSALEIKYTLSSSTGKTNKLVEREEIHAIYGKNKKNLLVDEKYEVEGQLD